MIKDSNQNCHVIIFTTTEKSPNNEHLYKKIMDKKNAYFYFYDEPVDF